MIFHFILIFALARSPAIKVCTYETYYNFMILMDIQIVPQKMIIRLSASISFEIVNWSEYALE